MALHKSIWRPAIIAAPQEAIIEQGDLCDLDITWFPPAPPYTFYADPFPLWRNNKLYVFVEAYDYWSCHGYIDVFIFDRQLQCLDHKTALKEPWHLSYPFIFEADGNIWLLPEAWKSGKLTLYKALSFPTQWEAAFTIDLDDPVGIPIDATLTFHQGRWWLFYSPQKPTGPVPALHVAYADKLDGPWHRHPQNPIVTGKSFSRPGGTLCSVRSQLTLPVQDCLKTYGGALRFITFHKLTPTDIKFSISATLTAPPCFAPFCDGVHTLAGAENVTLIDAKYKHFSLKGFYLELRHQYRKMLSKLSGRSSSQPPKNI